MAKNPKLDALTKQAALLKQRIDESPPNSTEAAKLTRELGKIDRLIDLYQQQEVQAARIADAESRFNAQARKDDTRLKVIVGAALLTDVGLRPETRRGLAELLSRAVTAPRDREFLKTKGWL